jgi:hypothetical protein
VRRHLTILRNRKIAAGGGKKKEKEKPENGKLKEKWMAHPTRQHTRALP